MAQTRRRRRVTRPVRKGDPFASEAVGARLVLGLIVALALYTVAVAVLIYVADQARQ